MPYVTQELRVKVDAEIENLVYALSEIPAAQRSACVTYSFFRIIKSLYGKGDWMNRSEVYRILESCKREHERNSLDPYELTKQSTNGDVEPCATT